MKKRLIFIAIFTMLVSVSSVFAYNATEGKIVSTAPYSAAELKGLSQILIKSGPPELKLPAPGNDGIDAIFKDIAPTIKTFDGEKYDKINAKLILEASGLVAPNIYNFDFLYNLEGMRDNRTEFWQLYIELMSDSNKVQINQITADWTLVPDRYVESGKEIAVKSLDENIRIKTPVFADSKWLPESNSSIVLKFKDTGSSAITDVTLDLNEKRITNIEKRYWGETFSIDIAEFGQANLLLKTDTIYGCYNFEIIANTQRSGDRIVVDINGIDRQGGYCEAAMGPARYEVNLGDLNGTIDLVLKYEGEEDLYKMEVSDETFEIIPLASGFTHFEHPLSLLRIPKNVIWVECSHYDRIGCEENNEYISVCSEFFNDLEKFGAVPFKLKNGTYTFKSDLPNKKSFKYTGNITKLENLVKKYSKNTKREIVNKGCTLLEVRTWRGDWFFSWNLDYENAQEIPDMNGSDENGNAEREQISGFGSILGIVALVFAARLRRAF